MNVKQKLQRLAPDIHNQTQCRRRRRR